MPGGSLMLLFVILGPPGLTADQIGIVVALALAINPITDMFETMNNIIRAWHAQTLLLALRAW